MSKLSLWGLRMSDIERAYERRLTRHAVSSVVDIYDKDRETYIGRLVNIHQEGLMLMGDVRLEIDHLYQLQLQLPSPINGRSVVSMGVDCLWTRASEDNRQHWSGFHIIDISDEALADILCLIEAMDEQ